MTFNTYCDGQKVGYVRSDMYTKIYKKQEAYKFYISWISF